MTTVSRLILAALEAVRCDLRRDAPRRGALAGARAARVDLVRSQRRGRGARHSWVGLRRVLRRALDTVPNVTLSRYASPSFGASADAIGDGEVRLEDAIVEDNRRRMQAQMDAPQGVMEAIRSEVHAAARSQCIDVPRLGRTRVLKNY